MKTYKVIQWATGVVGTSCVKSVVRHPRLELVGAKVYSDDKAGRDVGDVVGIEDTGVIATQNVDEIMALEADCVLYCPLPWNVELSEDRVTFIPKGISSTPMILLLPVMVGIGFPKSLDWRETSE